MLLPSRLLLRGLLLQVQAKGRRKSSSESCRLRAAVTCQGADRAKYSLDRAAFSAQSLVTPCCASPPGSLSSPFHYH